MRAIRWSIRDASGCTTTTASELPSSCLLFFFFFENTYTEPVRAKSEARIVWNPHMHMCPENTWTAISLNPLALLGSSFVVP